MANQYIKESKAPGGDTDPAMVSEKIQKARLSGHHMEGVVILSKEWLCTGYQGWSTHESGAIISGYPFDCDDYLSTISKHEAVHLFGNVHHGDKLFLDDPRLFGYNINQPCVGEENPDTTDICAQCFDALLGRWIGYEVMYAKLHRPIRFFKGS